MLQHSDTVVQNQSYDIIVLSLQRYCRSWSYDSGPSSAALQNSAFFMVLGEITEADIGMIPLHCGSNSVNSHIQISPEIWIRIPDHFWLRFG